VSTLYTLRVIGTGNGDYAIDVNQTDTQGAERFQTVHGVASSGVSTTYSIRYDTGSLPPNPFIRTLTGRVIDGAGNGVSNVTITLSGTQSSATLTGSSGSYSLGSVTMGGSYTITATKPDFTFNPDNHTFTNLVDSQNANFTAVATPTPTPSPSPLQLLLEESGSVLNQAAALDSMLFLRDPFPVVNVANLLNRGNDSNTRVVLFALNLELGSGAPASSVIIRLVDSSNRNHDVPAEDVRRVTTFPFTQVIFRLPDGLPAGTCLVEIRAQGRTSNTGIIRIRI
jgi:hypothetical protein